MKSNFLTDQEITRVLASANGDEGNGMVLPSADDLRKIRSFGSEVTKCFAGLTDLTDPLKTEFLRVKSEIDKVLAGLAPSDQAPAALQANDVLRQLLSLLEYSQVLIGNLSTVAKSRTTASAPVISAEDLAVKVGEELTKTLASGAYLKKEDAQKQVDDAVAAARKEFEEDIQRRENRIKTLATAGVPTPDAEILGLKDDKAFDAAVTEAKGRIEALKPWSEKLGADRVKTLAFAPKETYDSSFSLISAVAATAVGTGGNPMAKKGEKKDGATTEEKTLRQKVGAV